MANVWQLKYCDLGKRLLDGLPQSFASLRSSVRRLIRARYSANATGSVCMREPYVTARFSGKDEIELVLRDWDERVFYLQRSKKYEGISYVNEKDAVLIQINKRTASMILIDKSFQCEETGTKFTDTRNDNGRLQVRISVGPPFAGSKGAWSIALA